MSINKNDKKLILFKSKSDKIYYIPKYNSFNNFYILDGNYRINKTKEIYNSYFNYDLNPKNIFIASDIITSIELIEKKQNQIGYLINDVVYTYKEYDKLIENLGISFTDNNVIISNSSENYKKYEEIQLHKREHYNIEISYTNIEFEIHDIPFDDSCGEYIEPTWHENLEKLDIYKFNTTNYAKNCCDKEAIKYGYSYRKPDFFTKCDNKEYTYPIDNRGLEFLQINGDYFGNPKMQYPIYYGTLDDIYKYENKIQKTIEDVFKKANLKIEPITLNNIQLKNIFDSVDDIITVVKKIKSKNSTINEYNKTISLLTILYDKLINIK
jgi:hypothetical protein